MTELKTLKDFKSEFKAEAKEGKDINDVKLGIMQKFLDENFIKKEDLRQEAIKWIEFYQKGDNESEESRQWIRMWIMKFFNIVADEEDLIK